VQFLFHQYQFLYVRKISCLDTVKINAAGKIAGLKLSIVCPGRFHLINQRSDTLSDNIEDIELYP